jgi:hypothetical protein
MKNRDSWNEMVRSDLANILSRLATMEMKMEKEVKVGQHTTSRTILRL